MASFKGYLFCKLGRIGTKSEGPDYYLQKTEEEETPIVKQVPPWKNDPNLHQHLGTTVEIEGDLTPDGIQYTAVTATGPA